jgi:hypothetical protein
MSLNGLEVNTFILLQRKCKERYDVECACTAVDTATSKN